MPQLQSRHSKHKTQPQAHKHTSLSIASQVHNPQKHTTQGIVSCAVLPPLTGAANRQGQEEQGHHSGVVVVADPPGADVAAIDQQHTLTQRHAHIKVGQPGQVALQACGMVRRGRRNGRKGMVEQWRTCASQVASTAGLWDGDRWQEELNGNANSRASTQHDHAYCDYTCCTCCRTVTSSQWSASSRTLNKEEHVPVSSS
jgi:hypothetical protein